MRHKTIIEQHQTLLEKAMCTNPRAGFTLAQLDEIYDKSNGKCAICGKVPGRRNLALDHDHSTGKIRGLLCTQCNAGLGMFKDNKELLKKAIEYLD